MELRFDTLVFPEVRLCKSGDRYLLKLVRGSSEEFHSLNGDLVDQPEEYDTIDTVEGVAKVELVCFVNHRGVYYLVTKGDDEVYLLDETLHPTSLPSGTTIADARPCMSDLRFVINDRKGSAFLTYDPILGEYDLILVRNEYIDFDYQRTLLDSMTNSEIAEKFYFYRPSNDESHLFGWVKLPGRIGFDPSFFKEIFKRSQLIYAQDFGKKDVNVTPEEELTFLQKAISAMKVKTFAESIKDSNSHMTTFRKIYDSGIFGYKSDGNIVRLDMDFAFVGDVPTSLSRDELDDFFFTPYMLEVLLNDQYGPLYFNKGIVTFSQNVGVVFRAKQVVEGDIDSLKTTLGMNFDKGTFAYFKERNGRSYRTAHTNMSIVW